MARKPAAVAGSSSSDEAKIGGSLYFGGTSILIVVTVTMDTVAQIQSYLLAHQYEGLIKKSKLRERRK